MSKTLEEIIAAPSLVREQWLSPELAVREVLAFERRLGSKYLMLACHAALPLILTPELVNLIHINFLEGEQIPWVAEVDFLLSPLCRPIDEGLYEVEPSVREVLLVELENKFDWQRPFELARFLSVYLKQKPYCKKFLEVTRTQSWIAQAYLNPDSLIEKISNLFKANSSEEDYLIGLPGQIQVATMLEILAEPLERTNQQEEYRYLVNNSQVLAYVLYGDGQVLRQVIKEQKANSNLKSGDLIPLSPVIVKQLEDIDPGDVLLLWRRKLVFLEKELAIVAGATERFALEIRIEECQRKLQELEDRICTDNLRPDWKQYYALPAEICKNQESLYEYLESTIPRLREKYGFLDIKNNVAYGDKTLNVVARKKNFDMSIGFLNMRGEAFFLFSEFYHVNIDSLREYSTQCLKYAKAKTGFSSTVGGAVDNFKFPNNLCFAVALVDDVDDNTRRYAQRTNPLRHTVDSLWYEVPIIYELNTKRLYFYEEPSDWVDKFTGELVWKELRRIIRESLVPQLL
ncbi:MAG: hypothetical protein AB4426_22740 [Xenococcaceae cyanobacterium]